MSSDMGCICWYAGLLLQQQQRKCLTPQRATNLLGGRLVLSCGLAMLVV